MEVVRLNVVIFQLGNKCYWIGIFCLWQKEGGICLHPVRSDLDVLFLFYSEFSPFGFTRGRAGSMSLFEPKISGIRFTLQTGQELVKWIRTVWPNNWSLE